MAHFSTVFLVHATLLLVSLTILEESKPLKTFGSKIVNFNLSKDFGNAVAAVKRTAPVPKTSPTGTGPVVKAKPQEETVQGNASENRPGSMPGNGTGTGALSGSAIADLKTMYFSELRAMIDQKKFYPAVARRLQQQGEPVVGFTLDTDGKLSNIRIIKSSSNTRLDDAALEAVKSVKKFKALPKEIGESAIDMEIPVRFQLL